MFFLAILRRHPFHIDFICFFKQSVEKTNELLKINEYTDFLTF